jgi:hypothetical protein
MTPEPPVIAFCTVGAEITVLSRTMASWRPTSLVVASPNFLACLGGRLRGRLELRHCFLQVGPGDDDALELVDGVLPGGEELVAVGVFEGDQAAALGGFLLEVGVLPVWVIRLQDPGRERRRRVGGVPRADGRTRDRPLLEPGRLPDDLEHALDTLGLGPRRRGGLILEAAQAPARRGGHAVLVPAPGHLALAPQTWELHLDEVAAHQADVGLGHPERVHPVADPVERLVHDALIGVLRSLQHDRQPALQVEAEERPGVRDEADDARPNEQADDHQRNDQSTGSHGTRPEPTAGLPR